MISRIMLPDFINFAVLNLAIVARQFVEMTRIRIEVNQFGFEVLFLLVIFWQGLLTAFPKLLSTDAKQQHTFIETEAVR